MLQRQIRYRIFIWNSSWGGQKYVRTWLNQNIVCVIKQKEDKIKIRTFGKDLQ